MKENTYKPQIPDMMEAIFDAAYLTFDLVAAILFFIYAISSVMRIKILVFKIFVFAVAYVGFFIMKSVSKGLNTNRNIDK